MSDESKALLGDLLVEFGIITEADVDAANKLSIYTGLPFGKSLILLECITENVLKAALESQVLLRERVASYDTLNRAMKIVCRQQWQLSDALISLGHDAHATSRTRLGELLSDARIINQMQLDFALQAADFSCLPLGRVLTSFDAVCPEAIDKALFLQRSIRRGSMERFSALEQMRVLFTPELVAGMHFRLGDLFLRTGLLSEKQIEQAIQGSTREKKLIGQYLIEQGAVSEEVLMAVLCIQHLLDAQLISLNSACDVILHLAKYKQTMQPNWVGASLYHFLRASGYLNNDRLKVIARPQNEAAAGKTSGQFQVLVEPSVTVASETASASPAHANTPVTANAVETKANNAGEEPKPSLLHDQTFLREELIRAFPAETPIVNSGVLLHELVKVEKLTLNQALVIFAFTQSNLRMSVA